MCEPVTIMLAVSTVMGAMAQKQASDASNDAAERAAQHAEREARAREKDAEHADKNARRAFDAVEETNKEAARLRGRQADQVKSLQEQQAAGFAANNIFAGGDSAADLIDETGMLGFVDRRTMFVNSQREAFGYQQQGEDYLHAGMQNRFASNQLMASAQDKRASKSNANFAIAATLAKGASGMIGSLPAGSKGDPVSGFAGSSARSNAAARRLYGGGPKNSFKGPANNSGMIRFN